MGYYKQQAVLEQETSVGYPGWASLDDDDWLRPPYVEELPNAQVAMGCQHQWKDVPGIYKVYTNCKLCGVRREDIEEGGSNG